MRKLSMTLSAAEVQTIWEYITEISISSARLLGYLDSLQAREEEFHNKRKLIRLVFSEEADESAKAEEDNG